MLKEEQNNGILQACSSLHAFLLKFSSYTIDKSNYSELQILGYTGKKHIGEIVMSIHVIT